MKQGSSLPHIGIVGGAGPMAGLQLVQHIIQICQNKHGCKDDADFPYIMLLSYPFADMLQIEAGKAQRHIVERQLISCLDTFAKNDIEIAAIACNTLHEFLHSLHSVPLKFVHMIDETAQFLQRNEIEHSLVFCTETSALTKLHTRYFPVIYPEEEEQKKIDAIIQHILAGRLLSEDAQQMAEIALKYEKTNPSLGIILGCTELPLLADRFPLKLFGLRSPVIDPMTVVAEEICKIVFKESLT